METALVKEKGLLCVQHVPLKYTHRKKSSYGEEVTGMWQLLGAGNNYLLFL